MVGQKQRAGEKIDHTLRSASLTSSNSCQNSQGVVIGPQL